MGLDTCKEEAQSIEMEKWGLGEKVNRGRGEICTTAVPWGSPTEQKGMLLMDMSDIVLTSSLWIVQYTQNHIHMHKHTVQHSDICISILMRTLH